MGSLEILNIFGVYTVAYQLRHWYYFNDKYIVYFNDKYIVQSIHVEYCFNEDVDNSFCISEYVRGDSIVASGIFVTATEDR